MTFNYVGVCNKKEIRFIYDEKNHTKDFGYYDPAMSYFYKRWNANLRLIQRGLEKRKFLNI
ncbi:hypothetical protein LEP1GSC062_0428 [Leptospira alexanderi serovar Manhao 3 str. L 60]|uniref:Uncharacterized protein n=1 Tax=Leptospira alexanderi serovar Manhao 3 str. L 60 TaxID=1049759 RepID=V6I9K5_9LEPT|nr:hypothetical protein LEP1GSC062_0428 [Leptospira alexanderi serovar Manhao 3 str. L 60]